MSSPAKTAAAVDFATKGLAALSLPLAIWALNLAGERAQVELRLKNLEDAQQAHTAQLRAVEKTLESLDTTARFILRDIERARTPR